MTGSDSVPPWAGDDLADLLTLDAAAPLQFRNRCGDRNAHDRTYGGQLLGQALMAASSTVPAGRAPTTMQFLFLHGAMHRQAITFDVTPLQDGKRFSSRHVRGSQAGGRMIFDAQVSFAVALDAPAHGAAIEPLALQEDPDTLPRMADLPAAWGEEVMARLGYGLIDKPSVQFRLPALSDGFRLQLPEPRLRFWLKTTQTLPDDPVLHAAAFAYLSDWWLNYPAMGGHLQSLGAGERLYVASLNHAIWLHAPLRADQWLHFDCSSPAAGAGRGLTVARIHSRSGQMVASATQECLMAPRAVAG